MIRYGNSLPAKLALSNSNHNNVSHRQIVHSRIENEEMIFIKYELGKKIGQVSSPIYISKFLNFILFLKKSKSITGKFWRRLRNDKSRDERQIRFKNN